MNKYFLFIMFSLFCLSSCSVLNRTVRVDDNALVYANISDYCKEEKSYKSLYINKIESSFLIGEERYDAKISIYYIPDSAIYFTASNTGFEIMRGAVFPDSIYIINRLEKMVYVDRIEYNEQESTVNFSDLEFLLNKTYLCSKLADLDISDDNVLLDYSSQDVTRKILWHKDISSLHSFQFYHKKTGEYILGEFLDDNSLNLYSDYIIGPMEVSAAKGIIEFDKELSVNLSVNRAKYSYFYLR